MNWIERVGRTISNLGKDIDHIVSGRANFEENMLREIDRQLHTLRMLADPPFECTNNISVPNELLENVESSKRELKAVYKANLPEVVRNIKSHRILIHGFAKPLTEFYQKQGMDTKVKEIESIATSINNLYNTSPNFPNMN